MRWLAGLNVLAKVQFSSYGGCNWSDAAMGRDYGRYSFRQWQTTVSFAQAGSRTLMVRAIDSTGQAQRQAAVVSPVHFTALDVSLPAGSTLFPPGDGAEIANANCAMCHSTAMVLRQPALTTPEWKTEITKMHNGFGAPIPLDQVDQLARHLGVINGKKNETGPSGVDNQIRYGHRLQRWAYPQRARPYVSGAARFAGSARRDPARHNVLVSSGMPTNAS